MTPNNDNTSLDDLNEALPSYARVDVGAGRMVNLEMVAVIAVTVTEMLAVREDLFGGKPKFWYEEGADGIPILEPRAAAEWACEKTQFACMLPDIIKSTGACVRSTKPKYAIPFVISALARYEPFVTAVAERFEARVEPTAIREEKLRGYLERYGERLIFEALDKFSTPERSCMMSMAARRELVLETHLETRVGKAMPISGLGRDVVDAVLEDWMLEHDDSVHRLLGDMPPFGAEYE